MSDGNNKTYGKYGPLVGAIDEGTSSCRFIIFKENSSESVASHQIPLATFHPQEGWVEQDPLEILKAVYDCMDRAVDSLISLGGKPEDIIAIGITNQRETTLVWDVDTGKPLYNAIVWQDMRTSTTVEKLLDKVPNHTRNQNYLKPVCGLPLSPYFSAVKLRWLLDDVDVVRRMANKQKCLFGTVDTWIIWNLTGGPSGGKHLTDVTNASRTMLMNIETLKWDPLLLRFFGIPQAMLPEIKTCSELYGYISDGKLKGIPLMGCIGDQQSALVGQMCWKKGQAKATYGTGCFVLYNTGEICVNAHSGLLTTVAFQLEGNAPYYALEGSVAVAGTAMGWLKDNMGMIEDVTESSAVLSKVQEEGSVVFVPAFSGLYAPYWRRDARGVICGITIDTTANHIVKAALEAVCHQVGDILRAMNKDCEIPLEFLKVDGGMTTNSELMQMQADFTGIKVIRSALTESTALGAAIMALWGVQRHKGMTPLLSSIDTFSFSPKMSIEEREDKHSVWKMAVERSLGWDQ